MTRLALLLWLALAPLGCGDGAAGGSGWAAIAYDPADPPPALLSETGLVRWDAAAGRVEYHPDLATYEMATPLFSDYALKARAIWLPPGQPMAWRDTGLLELPVGTVILKSFLVAADLRAPTEDLRLVETRLLVRKASGWEAWPYIWRDDGSDAERWVSGRVLDVSFLDHEGDLREANYLIPQKNQCLDCHERRAEDGSGPGELVPIGPTGRNLARVDTPGGASQLERLAERGLLTGLPAPGAVDAAFDWRQLERPVDEVQAVVAGLSDGEVERAARDYLDANCAHCHNPRGVEGVSSQLFLDVATTAPFELGVCKPPGSAGKGGFGREYDIVPGDPEASILIYRLDSEDPGAMMPDLGRSLRHDQAMVLLREWIARMPGGCAD